MAAQEKVKTRCPVCQSAYRVPSVTVGHRARCPKCGAVFRVGSPTADRSGESPSSTPATRPDSPHRQRAERPSRHPGAPSSRGPAGDSPRHVSEEDILRWLTESNDDDLPPEPRRWVSPPQPAEKASTAK